MRRPFPRNIITICVCLLLGAIVNVTVAWGCAYWVVSNPRTLEKLSDQDSRRMLKESFDDWTDNQIRQLDGHELRGLGVCRRFTMSTHEPDRVYSRSDESSGIPMMSLFGQQLSTQATSQARHGWLLPGIWDSRMPGFSGLVIPLLPLWPGFAINTVFYAAVLWLLLIGPGRLRRFTRRRRGLCPACAYPIGTNNLCTECGKPVPHAANAIH